MTLAPRTLGQLVLVCATQNATSGGSSDTEVKELAARPHGSRFIGSSAVIATTPVANLPSTDRNLRLSSWPLPLSWDWPFGIEELLARLRAAIRRQTPTSAAVIETGDLRIDLDASQVSMCGVPVRLTRIEWKLVEVLARNSGRLVSQRSLLQQVWGPEYGTEANYLRVHMAALRRKLEADPSHPAHFITEAGMGYRFVS